MTKSTKTKLIVSGVILLLCLPASVIVAGIYAYSAPRWYFSSVFVEFVPAYSADLRKAFEAASQQLGESVALNEVRNTDLFQITVHDTNPQEATDRANAFVASFQTKLEQSNVGRMSVKQLAEPASYPARPNVLMMILAGAGIGSIAAALGLSLLLIGLLNKTHDNRSELEP